MFARWEVDGEELLGAPWELEEGLRSGRVPHRARTAHPEWTGGAWRPVDEVPALQSALEAPDARLARFMRTGRFPWMTLTLLGAVLVGTCALAPEEAALGWRRAFLDGAWWTPWTAPLAHAGPLHLIANLPVLAYCAWRVERALGPASSALVAAASVCVSSLLILLFSELPVVGSSTVAFGVWGAQIAVGLRFGDAIPSELRGRYGWGNLVFFVPLFVGGLGADGVSDLGHAGGLLGGVATAMLVPSESRAPPHGCAGAALRNLALAGLVGVAIPVAVAALRPFPTLWAAPGVPVAEEGATVTLPERLALNVGRMAGMAVWAEAVGENDFFFVGRWRTASAEQPSERALAATWEELLRGAAEPGDAPVPPPAGGTAHAWRLDDRLVVEVQVQHGLHLWRVGWVTDEPCEVRTAMYAGILRSLAVGDPPSLARARRDAARWPDSPEHQWRLAEELGLAGQYEAADGVYAALSTGDWARDAAAQRLDLWRLRGLRGDVGAARRWAETGDERLREAASRWLLARGG
jgi:membrane associated rhomboid family serine protease